MEGPFFHIEVFFPLGSLVSLFGCHFRSMGGGGGGVMELFSPYVQNFLDAHDLVFRVIDNILLC